MELIKVLLDEKGFLVLNKPPGMLCHSAGKSDEETVASWISKKYPEIKSVGGFFNTTSGEEIPRSGIVHRLDKETSGVLVVAKDDATFEFLQTQFQEREINKTYHAFVYGVVKNDDGIIDRPIGRSGTDFRKRTAGRGARGLARAAVTEYRVLRRGTSSTFVEAHPKTGRNHQIRVHFSFIHHPVVADHLYAPNRESILGFKRLALHSRSIEFTDFDRETVKVEAPYPKDFEKALKEFKDSKTA